MKGDCHICFSVSKRCRNPYESYGEICVGCGCCSSNKLRAARAQMALYMRLLEEKRRFDGWFYDDPQILELQRKNNAESIKYFEDEIAKYRKIVEELEAADGGIEQKDPGGA